MHGDPDASPAHRCEFSTALTAALPGFTAAFLAVEGHGGMIGGCPVVIERRAALRWIHAMPVLPVAELQSRRRAGRARGEAAR